MNVGLMWKYSKLTRTAVAALACMLACIQPGSAIILFGLDNSANLTDPGTGVPFDAVAKVYNTGDGITRGSAVHLGGGYMLTANHVAATVGQSFTFDGVTSYALDTGFTPTQVAAGVDLKVFRLTTVPVASAVSLSMGGEQVAAATLVGWGRGRDPAIPVGSSTVTWGDHSTVAKRWGENVPRDLMWLGYNDYNFIGIRTVLGSDTGSPPGLGANEAAATQYDSGAGMFQFIGGEWRLIGVAVAVQANGVSVFGDDGSSAGKGHDNYFVYINAYRDDILMLIPEPSSALMLMAATGLMWRRRAARG
jgi:hypothetical protein